MGFYLSKSLGGGFRVIVPIRRRRRRKDESGLVLSLCYLLFFLMLIWFAVAYWPLAVGLFIAFCVVAMLSHVAKDKRARLAEVKTRILPLARKLQRHCKLATRAKTLGARVNNCAQAITLLEEIKTLDPQGSVVADTDPLLARLRSLSKALPVIDALDKAERAEFRGQTTKALDAYLDGLYQCHAEDITDDDFEVADVRDHHKQRVSLDYIQQKVRSLGGIVE